jgi:putative phosphotransacetylase
LEILFGKGYELTVFKPLSYPGYFAANETVTLETARGTIERVRVLGPERKQTQVEISQTDAYKLGLNPPVRESGNLAGSEKVTLIGPQGRLDLPEGAIIAWRHIHLCPADAAECGLKDKQTVSVKVGGERELVFHQVLIRIQPEFFWSTMHIDTDEANAVGIKGEGKGEIFPEP